MIIDAISAMTMVACLLSLPAAWATAWAWLPREAAISRCSVMRVSFFEGAPDLERSGLLEILELEVDVRAGQDARRAGKDERCPMDREGDGLAGLPDVAQCDHDDL